MTINCTHAQTDIIPTPDGPHHGKLICRACGRFAGWAPKPATFEREKRNARLIVALRHDSTPLSAWERQFVTTLDGQGPKMSPKQQVALNRLAERFHL